MGQCVQKITDDIYIRKLIGSGRYGIVYEGYDCKIKKIVAVKKINKKQTANYKREKQVLQKISVHNHQHIMKYYRSVQPKQQDKKDYLFLILQLCTGGTLRDYMTRGISELETLRIFKQIVSAMKFLHTSKEMFLHRDLKPQNILLDFNNNIKIADFGTARQFSSVQMTQGVGTVKYIAPELKTGFLGSNNKNYKSKCDVWSAGMILHQMLTGSLIKISTVYTKIQKINFNLPKQSIWLRFLNKMLVIQPQKRLQFTNIQKMLIQFEQKIQRDIFNKYGYQHIKIQYPLPAKNQEQAKSTNLHFERSIQTLKLATQYLHFIKEKHHFYKKVIQEIKQNQSFCLNYFYKITINYLMIAILKKKKQKLLMTIRQQRLETPHGQINSDCIESCDQRAYKFLIQKHYKYLKQDIDYWSEKLQENNFRKQITNTFQKYKDGKSQTQIGLEKQIIRNIQPQIQNVSLQQFQNAFQKLCELKEFRKIFSQKLLYRDVRTYAFILFLKDIENQIPDKQFQTYNIIRKKKKQLVQMERKELDKFILSIRK